MLRFDGRHQNVIFHSIIVFLIIFLGLQCGVLLFLPLFTRFISGGVQLFRRGLRSHCHLDCFITQEIRVGGLRVLP